MYYHSILIRTLEDNVNKKGQKIETKQLKKKTDKESKAWTYLQPHYSNGDFGNDHLSGRQHFWPPIAAMRVVGTLVRAMCNSFFRQKGEVFFSLGNHLVLYRDMLIYKSQLKYNRYLRESSSLEELCHLVKICLWFWVSWCF